MLAFRHFVAIRFSSGGLDHKKEARMIYNARPIRSGRATPSKFMYQYDTNMILHGFLSGRVGRGSRYVFHAINAEGSTRPPLE